MLSAWNAFQTGVTLIGRDPMRLFAVADTECDQLLLRNLIARSGLDADIIETLTRGAHQNLQKACVDVIIHAACSYDAATVYIKEVGRPLNLPIVSISDVPLKGLEEKTCPSKVTRLFKTGLTPELLGSVVLDTTLAHRNQRPQKAILLPWQTDLTPITVH